ncbi:unnamed protein product [Arctia plantaginis]|uniref:Uncharacterized protein n=1 Tax=Arctia plantaginis TaxID=874455 RepID=A0A8S1B9I4_ARCPL|nr:unnamed protein product [Arctia plantaginis]CAB3258443.1 unnamed protein product [Arctia plantaginis]
MKTCKYMILRFLTLLVTVTRSIGESQKRSPTASEFTRHTVVQPVLLHGTTKRKISTTRDESGAHHLEVILKVLIDDEEYLVDLRLNLELVTENHVLSYQNNGTTVLYKPHKEEIESCHYSGSVRGKSESWVAVSTCHGIQGLLFDGERTRYIEPPQESLLNAGHHIYDHLDLLESHLRRYDRTERKRSTSDDWATFDETEFQGPHKANEGPFYVELVLVVDRSYFEAYNRNICFVHKQMQTIANILNSVYSKLDIFIALAGVEVWNEYDKITFSSNSTISVVNFLEYRSRELINNIPNDVAQLLTLKYFDGGIVGKAMHGAICSHEFSGGIISSNTKSMGLLAMTIAHEMGHNFGMDHDYKYDDHCKCRGKQCIMWAYRTHTIPTGWSTCSLKKLKFSLSTGIGFCLRNKPRSLIEYPICGNGILDLGEQCDCSAMTVVGTYLQCYVCCDPSTCMLRANATCDTGECCHLSICKNHKCRSSAAAIDGIAKNNSAIHPSNCPGFGVCNSTGHCFCEPDHKTKLDSAYNRGTLCTMSEPGITAHRLPTDENSTFLRKTDVVLYVMILGTVPAILLIICAYKVKSNQ